MKATQVESHTQLPRQSSFGLNAANFFQAEMVGVLMPVLNVFLKNAHWRYDAIGVATAAGGLGTLIFQSPAGTLTDRISRRRLLFAVMALITGACFIAIAMVPSTPVWIDSLLFVSGAAQSFFGPLLGALALGLAGHQLLNRTMGTNQSWNHAGNVVAALTAVGLVPVLGLNSVFYSVGVCALFAATSVLLIREKDLNEKVATGLMPGQDKEVKWTELFRDRRILFLFISIFAFHLANAPILPTVALSVKK